MTHPFEELQAYLPFFNEIDIVKPTCAPTEQRACPVIEDEEEFVVVKK